MGAEVKACCIYPYFRVSTLSARAASTQITKGKYTRKARVGGWVCGCIHPPFKDMHNSLCLTRSCIHLIFMVNTSDNATGKIIDPLHLPHF